MADFGPPGSDRPASALAGDDQLGSWKEIANYLDRTVRTVQRWEQSEGLPVRRLQHDSGSSVFAYQHELDQWLAQRSGGSPDLDAGRTSEPAQDNADHAASSAAAKQSTATGNPPANQQTNRLLLGVLAVVVIALTVTVLNQRTAQKPSDPVQHQLPRSLTTKPGIERFPALAPDGQRVVYAWTDQNGRVDLFLRLVGVDEHIRLTDDEAVEESPTWSPDGLSIAFLRRSAPSLREVRIIPAMGGSDRLVARLPVPEVMDTARSIFPGLDWSPDGRFLVTNQGDDNPEVMNIVVIELETGVQIALTEAEEGVTDLLPKFSPDGRQLVFSRSASALKASLHVMMFDPDAPGPGRSWKLADATAFNTEAEWTIDGQGLVFSSGRWPRMRLWHIPADGSAEPAPLPGTGQGGSQPSIAPLTAVNTADDAWRMVYRVASLENDIWQVSLDSEEDIPLLSSSQRERYPTWAADGRIAFLSDRSGHREAWVADTNGQNWQQWTDIQSAYLWRPQFSPDGSRLAYIVEIDNAMRLYVQDGPLAPRRDLTPPGSTDTDLAWSLDGKTLYTLSPNREGAPGLWAFDLGNAEPRRLLDGPWRPLGENPNPAGAAELYITRATPDGAVLHTLNLSTGNSTPVPLTGEGLHSFTTGPGGVYFLVNDRNQWSIQRWNRANNTQELIRQLDHEPEAGMTISPDGQSALLARIVLQRSDLMVLDSTHAR